MGETVHMWTNRKNCVYSNCSDYENTAIWTDNGSVELDTNWSCYFIIPKKTGRVNLFSIETNVSGKKDTTLVTKKFSAIIPPKISLKLIEDNYTKNGTIKISLVNTRTGRPVNKRYKIGRMFEPYVYNERDSIVGRIGFCFDPTIKLENGGHSKFKLESGYKIKINVYVRDWKTDLLIPAENTLIYTIK